MNIRIKCRAGIMLDECVYAVLLPDQKIGCILKTRCEYQLPLYYKVGDEITPEKNVEFCATCGQRYSSVNYLQNKFNEMCKEICVQAEEE